MHFVRSSFALIVSIFFLFGQEGENTFGKVDLRIDAAEKKTLPIQNALLYERASIDFDTTVQVQDASGLLIYYYPQVISGEENILRLIVQHPDQAGKFYDIIVNLGDSLQGRIDFENDSARVFFSRNGELITFRRYSREINGTVLLLEGLQEKQMISGEMDLSFAMPVREEADDYSTIAVKGVFEVPVGEFRSVSLSASAPVKEEKKNYRRNLYLALIISAMAIIALGLQ